MTADPVRPDDRLRQSVACEEHGGRLECTAMSKRSQQRCHGVALQGLGKCRMHVGESVDVAKAKGRALLRAVQDRSGVVVTPQRALLDEVERCARLVAWWESELGELPSFIRTTEKGEEVDLRYRLYQQERESLRRSADAAAARGVEQQLVDITREQATRLAGTIERIIRALGHDPNDPEVRETVRKQLIGTSG